MAKRKKEKLQLVTLAEAEAMEEAGSGLFWDKRPPLDRMVSSDEPVRVSKPLTYADLQSMIELNPDEIELVMN